MKKLLILIISLFCVSWINQAYAGPHLLADQEGVPSSYQIYNNGVLIGSVDAADVLTDGNIVIDLEQLGIADGPVILTLKACDFWGTCSAMSDPSPTVLKGQPSVPTNVAITK